MKKEITGKAYLGGILLTVLTLTIFAIRLAGPTDLEADAQQRNVGYVMDAVWNGNWLVQIEARGWIMSKPPMHTWLAGAFGLMGGVNRLTLTLPSAFAVLAMTLLVYRVGRQRFGLVAGICAGLACVLAPLMSRHIALVRTDALFALMIALTAFAAYRAWERGGGWTPFWLAGAAATLVKGPLGLVLGAAGLLAWFWEKRTDSFAPPPRGAHGPGLALFLSLTLGWLLLAVYFYGYAVIDKLFFDELFGQVTGMRKDITPGENVYKPILFLIVRFLPFSLFACYGLWRVVRHPVVDVAERRFERFLFAWIAAGLLMFSVGAHFRADLLLPLWPAAALLAGREMAHLGQKIGLMRMAAATAMVAVFLVGAIYWNYHTKVVKNKEVRYSVETENAANALIASGLPIRQIRHLDSPATLQLYLGSFTPYLAAADALRLANSETPLLLAVEKGDDYPDLFAPGGPLLQEVFRWPSDFGREATLRIFGNSAFLNKATSNGSR
jgi:4-amino-4-deoxy-L-arabinose transferase-like glycosyltransferase